MTSPYLQRPLRSEAEVRRQIDTARFRHASPLMLEPMLQDSVMALDTMTHATMALTAANEDTAGEETERLLLAL